MKNDKKELILDAAERILVSNANENISMSLIAKEAGIAKGGSYYYFKSRDEVLYALIERAYHRAVCEYSNYELDSVSPIEKIQILLKTIMKKEFEDSKENVLHAVSISNDVLLHNYTKLAAIAEISPVLEKILAEGIENGSMHMEVSPSEVAKMIVAVFTFILDSTVFNAEESKAKIAMFSRILETCLNTEKGAFSFLTTAINMNDEFSKQ